MPSIAHFTAEASGADKTSSTCCTRLFLWDSSFSEFGLREPKEPSLSTLPSHGPIPTFVKRIRQNELNAEQILWSNEWAMGFQKIWVSETLCYWTKGYYVVLKSRALYANFDGWSKSGRHSLFASCCVRSTLKCSSSFKLYC
jgi:hypothetical protein